MPASVMARVIFTPHLQRHVTVPPCEAPGATVREVLDRVFAEHPRARGYVLDEHGAVRHHVLIAVGGEFLRDRASLSDPVPPDGEIYVLQALSGG